MTPVSLHDSKMQMPDGTGFASKPSTISGRRPSDAPSNVPRNAESPVSPAHRASLTGSGLSQVLASVDSEGVWLTGRPTKRTSVSALHPGPSTTSLHRIPASPEEDDVGDITEITNTSSDITTRRSSDDHSGAASEVGDDSHLEEAVVHSGLGRQPTVIHRDSRIVSSEGLLNRFYTPNESLASTPSGPAELVPGAYPEITEEEEEDLEEEEEVTPGIYQGDEEQDPVTTARVQSVTYDTHHMRALSAGSAKLLDIPARPVSYGRRTPSPDERSFITAR